LEARGLVEIAGDAQAILTGERTALNFLAHLCGIATTDRRFVEQLAGRGHVFAIRENYAGFGGRWRNMR